ncbi:MAG TPA: RidA family protein, partial [Ferruginibacter sp.]|nr:RidA family protein [Ferruginibacter sp.]
IPSLYRCTLLKNSSMRIRVSSGSPWEDIVGYSRAIRAGDIIEVAGTTAMDGDKLVGKGDVYLQTRFIFEKIARALEEAGGSLQDVIRTRMYITDISKWEEAGRAHEEFFSEIKPVATMVEVSQLIDKELLIEIEVSAIVQDR